MDLLSIIKQRRSIRDFVKNQSIREETINLILEAGIYAPSAGNMQSWQFFVVLQAEMRVKLMEAAHSQKFVAESPCVIVVCIDTALASERYGERGKKFYAIQDTAAAVQNMLLMAHDCQLGACWVGAFDPVKVAEVLQLNEIGRASCRERV